MKKIIASLFFLFFILNSCQNPQTNTAKEVATVDSSIPKPDVVPTATVISNGDYKKLVNSADVVLVDFSATWCGPCKKLAPRLEELLKDADGEWILVNSDVDRDTNLADSLNITAMPTLMLYKNGNLIWRNEGLVEKELIQGKIDEARTQ